MRKGEREREEKVKKVVWKVRDRKQKKRQGKAQGGERLYGPMGDAKDETGKRSPGFPWELEKYLHTPSTFLPPSPPSPISAARFFDIGSGVSIFRSFASQSDFRTEPLLFPPCIQSLFPSLSSPISFISAYAPVSLSFSPSSSLPFPPATKTILILSLFSSRRRNVHQKIWILRRIVYDSVSRTFRHCARMTRGQREKLRAVLNECGKKRRDGDGDGDGRNLHWCTGTAFARI